MHLTGIYPSWWRGKRYKQPITAWVGGVSNETVRDINQTELLGIPGDPEQLGTGTIPRDKIKKLERKPGVPNAVSIAQIQHLTGTSYLYFLAYNMGPERWYGRSVDLVWLDELPPGEIYSQAVTRTLDKRGMVMMTYTPEQGFDRITAQFLNDLKKGQSLTNAGWDDASEKVETVVNGTPGHLSEAVMEQILATYSPHEREMRKHGRPSIGSGLVFPIMEEKILVEPFPIPDEWPRISAIDYGYDHPTAWVALAVDQHGTDEERVVIYDTYRQSKAAPYIHAEAIRRRGGFIPIAWPHDGNRRDSMGNPGLTDQYRSQGLNMLPTHFTNPPAVGEKKGNNSIETGIMQMLTMMEQGRFQVFNHLDDWLEEFRMYHRRDNKIVPLKDDLMSSTRYCVQSTRYAVPLGNSAWQGDLDYPDLGIV
jgi:phage terminase large subunit-like protein